MLFYLKIIAIALLATLLFIAARRRRGRAQRNGAQSCTGKPVASLQPNGVSRLHSQSQADEDVLLPPTVPSTLSLAEGLSSLTRLVSTGSCSSNIDAGISARRPKPREQNRMQQLRQRVQRDDAAAGVPGGVRWYEDGELLRFVRARKTIDESERLFREAMRWRREHAAMWDVDVSATGSFGPQLANYLEGGQERGLPQPPDWFTFLQENLSMGLFGRDKDGLPILYNAVGHNDLQGCAREVGMFKLQHFAVMLNDYFLDIARAATRSLEEDCNAGVVLLAGYVIFDMEGLSFSNIGKAKVFNEVSAVIKILHPERMQRCFIIRAPRIFARVWRLCRHVVDPRTVAKIMIIGHGESLEPLFSELGSENVPDFLGGTNTTVRWPSASTVSPGAFERHRARGAGSRPDSLGGQSTT